MLGFASGHHLTKEDSFLVYAGKALAAIYITTRASSKLSKFLRLDPDQYDYRPQEHPRKFPNA